MSEKNVKVPEGMLKSVASTWEVSSHAISISQAEAIIDAALRWLSENPIVPTDEQVKDCWQGMNPNLSSMGLHRQLLVEWQRRIFLAPENGDFEKMKQAIDERYRGKTITRSEADELIGMINRCVRPDAEPEFMECDTCRAKPGSPYLCVGCLHNREVINNLKKAGEK